MGVLSVLYESYREMRQYASDDDLYICASPEFYARINEEFGFGDPPITGARVFGLSIYVRDDVPPGAAYILDRRYRPLPT